MAITDQEQQGKQQGRGSSASGNQPQVHAEQASVITHAKVSGDKERCDVERRAGANRVSPKRRNPLPKGTDETKVLDFQIPVSNFYHSTKNEH
ncbi:hypothetical protein I5G05_05120 [Pseudomonas aeruginosa]|nr:hypothetical protein [Pseudomonas sp. B111]MBG5186805.1 hypothetical protein [Pseudomonas aeruginosa]MBI8028990.1 hypothetical protein [Pseudomonas aeruginosa]MDU3623685.1 hypothetical protein [Pseudomonas aeruginosa]MDU3700314.1 hypothetical protein [Pseudomonas aeruginosa]NTU02030.1 hypothetical protein [Pseudomonas aeruginosa]